MAVGRGGGFLSVTFPTELQDGSHLGGTARKELEQLCAQWEGFFRALGANGDGTFGNIIANSLTLVQNYNFPLPPTVPPSPGSVVSVSPDGSVSSCCGGVACACEIIPAGSLAFSGFGDAPIQFAAPDGSALPQPDYLPKVADTCGGMVALANGRVAIAGADTGSPDFFTQYVIDPELETIIGGENTSATQSISGNFAGSFYTYRTPSVANYEVLKYNSSGARVATFDMGFNSFPDINGPIAMAPDESFGYYAPRSPASDEVWQLDLAGGFTVLITKAGYATKPNSMMCLTDGTLLVGWNDSGAAGVVELYDNTGALIRTVVTLGTDEAPLVLTPGLNPTKTFWMSYYSSAGTFSGVTVAEIDIATGDVLNQFDPEVGAFEFDGPFCVLRQGIRAVSA